ncbi:MAG: FkbM family methyltransferase [Chthoniobacteraceae bacterium]
MKKWLQEVLKSHPRLFDIVIRRIKRQLLRRRSPVFTFLDGLSKSRAGRIDFVQIGANDGLRNDPVREFIVRDPWHGILIEPLPTVFEELRQNYGYLLPKRDISFENVAISAQESSLPFYTFREDFLRSLPPEVRLDMLRKSSFDRAHVAQFAKDPADIAQINVPCVPVAGIIKKYFPANRLDLLVIDAEGHEATILNSIDFSVTDIHAILFESEHIGAGHDPIFGMLKSHGYSIRESGRDAFAEKVT